MYCSGGSQVLFLIPLWPKPKTRARRQPEELTLLLIQLRRHQAKMAGVQSSSDAFTQLQQLQHNDLLGPSMQVRGSSPNLFYNPLQPFAPALWCSPPHPPPTRHVQPFPSYTTLSFIKTVWSAGIARLSCSISLSSMGSVAPRTVQMALKSDRIFILSHLSFFF